MTGLDGVALSAGCRRHGIESGELDARALASDHDVTLGIASGVTAAAELAEGGGLEAVRCGVQSLARVLSRKSIHSGTCPPRPPWTRAGRGAGSRISGSECLTIVFSAVILRHPL